MLVVEVGVVVFTNPSVSTLSPAVQRPISAIPFVMLPSVVAKVVVKRILLYAGKDTESTTLAK